MLALRLPEPSRWMQTLLSAAPYRIPDPIWWRLTQQLLWDECRAFMDAHWQAHCLHWMIWTLSPAPRRTVGHDC